MGSLQAHEVRINRSAGKEEEKAFQVKGGSDFSSSRGRGRGHRGFRGRGRGRNSSLQCSFCEKSGHSEKYCWSKLEEANYVQEEDDEQEYLFMTYTSSDVLTNDVWYLDSACTNHVTGDKSKFKDLDESVRSRVRLGDDKQLYIEGCGTVILTIRDKCKLIKDVQYAPRLAHNLISVEVALVNNQEMNDVDQWHLRNVMFDENADWKWKDDNSNQKLVSENDEEVQTQGEMLSNSYNATPTTGSHSSSLSS
nr:hypothetical protein [Tanacetum cinerariifolium]